MGGHHRLHSQKGPTEDVLPGQLRKHNLPQAMMVQFYTAIVESVLTFSIMVWFGSATKHDIQEAAANRPIS